MGVEINFYIQKNTNNKWENIFLYKEDNSLVDIWFCGRELLDNVVTLDNFGMSITRQEVEDLAKATGWITEEGDELPPYYVISLSKLMYLATKFNKIKFFKNLANEVNCYLRFADEDCINIDNIRIIALISY